MEKLSKDVEFVESPLILENNQAITLNNKTNNQVDLMENNTQLISSLNMYSSFIKGVKSLFKNAPDLITYPLARPYWEEITKIVSEKLVSAHKVNKEIDYFFKIYLSICNNLLKFEKNFLSSSLTVEQIITTFVKPFFRSIENIEETLKFLKMNFDQKSEKQLKKNFEKLIQEVSSTALIEKHKAITDAKNELSENKKLYENFIKNLKEKMN